MANNIGQWWLIIGKSNQQSCFVQAKLRMKDGTPKPERKQLQYVQHQQIHRYGETESYGDLIEMSCDI